MSRWSGPLDLSKGSRLVLQGVEWTVEQLNPQV